MPESRLVPLPDVAVAQWAASRPEGLPEAGAGERLEHLEIHLDRVAVGGVVLGHSGEGQGKQLTIRLLDTTLADDDLTHWQSVVEAIERRAGGVGATSVATAVQPGLAGTLHAAGFATTMTGVGITLGERRITPQPDRVTLRPMDDDQRSRFVAETREQLRAGMVNAGVEGDVEERLTGLAKSQAGELVLAAVADDATVGSVWVTLHDRTGSRDADVNTIAIHPDHRGRGLTRDLLSALETHLRELDVRRVRARLYAHDDRALDSFRALGMTVDVVHLRQDVQPDG